MVIDEGRLEHHDITGVHLFLLCFPFPFVDVFFTPDIRVRLFRKVGLLARVFERLVDRRSARAGSSDGSSPPWLPVSWSNVRLRAAQVVLGRSPAFARFLDWQTTNEAETARLSSESGSNRRPSRRISIESGPRTERHSQRPVSGLHGLCPSVPSPRQRSRVYRGTIRLGAADLDKAASVRPPQAGARRRRSRSEREHGQRGSRNPAVVGGHGAGGTIRRRDHDGMHD